MVASQARTAYLLLRLAAAFAFVYPPLSATFGDPYSWLGYFPQFIVGYVPDMVLLHAFGVVEIIVGFWILSGYKIMLPSLAAAAMLVAIVVFNLPQFDILFRDLSLAALCLALALMQGRATIKAHE